MKKTSFLALALSLLATAVFAADNKEVVANGSFSEKGDLPKNTKSIAGTQWVKFWSCAGGPAELKDGKLNLSSGALYQWLRLPGDKSKLRPLPEKKAF